MKKSECTPEQWAKYLELHRRYYWSKVEEARARARAYTSRPEVKERRKKYAETPEAAEKRRAKYGTPEHKKLRKAQYDRLRSDPERWSKKLDHQRRARTGMSRSDIARLRVLQEDRCGICERPLGDNPQHIRADHCHDSGSPRGLLCHHCNIIEGMLRGMKLTPEEFAAKVRAYLQHPPILSLKAER